LRVALGDVNRCWQAVEFLSAFARDNAAGQIYIFYVGAEQMLIVIAGASAAIRITGSVSAGAGNKTNAQSGRIERAAVMLRW